MKVKNNKLGIMLKKLRESRNLTVQELAIKSKTGVGTIGNIESGANGARMSTLEKISNALELNQKEKEQLFSSTIPDSVGMQLSKRDKLKLEEFLNEASLMFNDEEMSAEDKEKMIDSLNRMFFRAKELNKRNKK